MGLLDFLKGKKRRSSRRSGVRSGASRNRRAEMATRAMNAPKPLRPPTPLPQSATSADYNPTIARQVPDYGEPAPAPPRVDPPAPKPQRDAGATEYLEVPRSARGPVLGVLVAIEGELQGELYGVSDGVNKLGRGAGCDIELASKKISRDHAEIHHAHGMFAIKPLNPKNPTFLNDRETEGEELSDGDTIRLGQTTFKFRTV